jgi:arylsulfatase A-like enzyme
MVGPYPGTEYDPKVLTFWPSVFRKSGYFTGIIGKWHLGPDHGHGRDWDFSAVWDHTNHACGDYFLNQKISFNGGLPQAVGGYSTDNYTQYAVDFIQERGRDKKNPWYLWLCYDAVHGPYRPADRHRGVYRPEDSPVPRPEDLYPPRPTKPNYMKNYGRWKANEAGEPVSKGRTLSGCVQQYNRCILALDEGVGRVRQALEQTGQLDDTVVMLTSDQGFAWGQHGFEWKYAPYDANLRAPLLIRYPQLVPPATVCTHPVGGQDLIPTFFALAGIELPWKMHGRNLMPLLRQPDRKDWNEPVLMENTKFYYGDDTAAGTGPGWNGVPWWLFLREGKYKYVRTLVPGEIEELYDLESDPGELVNLALLPERQKTLVQYREKLLAELERTDAAMREHLPPVAGMKPAADP